MLNRKDIRGGSKLKVKAEIADNALLQFKLGLEDLRYDRVGKFNLKAS